MRDIDFTLAVLQDTAHIKERDAEGEGGNARDHGVYLQIQHHNAENQNRRTDTGSLDRIDHWDPHLAQSLQYCRRVLRYRVKNYDQRTILQELTALLGARKEPLNYGLTQNRQTDCRR